MGARARAAAAAGGPGPAAARRALRTVSAALARHNLGSGGARRPRARDPRRGGGRCAGGFLSALHQPAPAGAPVSLDGRGGPLADSRKGFARFLNEAVERGLIAEPDAVRAVWDDAVAAPAWDGPAIWLHGDLHPANVLTADGTFCGVIDFGSLCVGDPAWDLAAAWILLPTGAVERFYRAYRPAAHTAHTAIGADDSHRADAATRRRARGLAVIKALVCVLIGDAGEHGRPGGKPTWGPPGHAALQRLTATRQRTRDDREAEAK